MKITRAHLEFWRQRRTPTPKWAESVSEKTRRVSIDELIPQPKSKSVQPANTVAVLKLVRRRGSEALLRCLMDMAVSPDCISDPHKRRAFAKKWLDRILRERSKKP